MRENVSGLAHFVLVAVVALLLIVPASLITLQSIQTSDEVGGEVLKDSDEPDEEDNSGSGSSGSGDDSPSSTDSPDDDEDSEDSTSEFQMEVHDDGTIETQFESEDEDGVKVKLHSDGDDEKIEIRLSETERVRVRTKDGERRIDVYQGGVKLRFEYKDGRFIAKAEYEGEEDGAEIEEEDIFKIVDDLDKSNIKISTDSGRLTLARGNTSAATDFPLSLDLDTNSLVVTTPSGEKTISILPDQAIANLISANTISRAISDEIELGELDGEPVYEILGVSGQRLLGFIPVGVERTVDVSAETGNAVNISQSFLSRIIDALSF